MPDASLATDLALEQARAIRTLLRDSLVDAVHSPEEFRTIARHRAHLETWFETTCGWPLSVDVAAGFARLQKRVPRVDTSRPLRRTRGAAQPFDRRRYELLCHACAELVRQPHTTVGLLASALVTEAGLDTARHGERVAFVDALRALGSWGALQASGGDIDAFVENERGNAFLAADSARLHRLLSSAVPPSAVVTDDAGVATSALLAEPRYDGAEGEEQRLRWLRHSIARRVLDDPVVLYDDLDEGQRAYLANPAGRRWLRERVAEAGFLLEERAEGLLAVDAERQATDLAFPAPHGHAHQLALLLVDVLAPGAEGGRRLRPLGPAALRHEVEMLFARFPAWARGSRGDGDGPGRLAGEAVSLLAGFGLVRRAPDGTVEPLPPLARYRTGTPIISATLFEETS